MAFPAFWESKKFDFTVCKQQNLPNSLFIKSPELEKYLKKKLVPPDERGGGGHGPLPPQIRPCY